MRAEVRRRTQARRDAKTSRVPTPEQDFDYVILSPYPVETTVRRLQDTKFFEARRHRYYSGGPYPTIPLWMPAWNEVIARKREKGLLPNNLVRAGRRWIDGRRVTYLAREW